MKVSRLLPLVALTLVAAMACGKDQTARDQIAALTTQFDAVSKDFQQYKDWLGKGAQPEPPDTITVVRWFEHVRVAICNLEDKAQPPAAKRLCHPEFEHGSAPHPPPFF